MSFVGGLLVGGIVGLGAGVLLGRGQLRMTRPRGTPGWPGLALGALALLVAAVALIRSGHQDHPRAGAPSVSTTVPASAVPTTVPAAGGSGQSGGSGPTSTGGAAVSVPNVVLLSSADAVARLQQVGLRAGVTTLPLTNVPAGYVVTQNPQPATTVAAGTAVALVVSAAA